MTKKTNRVVDTYEDMKNESNQRIQYLELMRTVAPSQAIINHCDVGNMKIDMDRFDPSYFRRFYVESFENPLMKNYGKSMNSELEKSLISQAILGFNPNKTVSDIVEYDRQKKLEISKATGKSIDDIKTQITSSEVIAISMKDINKTHEYFFSQVYDRIGMDHLNEVIKDTTDNNKKYWSNAIKNRNDLIELIEIYLHYKKEEPDFEVSSEMHKDFKSKQEQERKKQEEERKKKENPEQQ